VQFAVWRQGCNAVALTRRNAVAFTATPLQSLRRRCNHCDAVAITRPKPPATVFGGTGAAAASFFALVSLRQRVSASWLDETTSMRSCSPGRNVLF
jgi:hypothetical protein